MTTRRRSILVAASGLAAVVFLVPLIARAAPATWTAVTWSDGFAQPFATSEAQGLALGGKLYSFGGFDLTKACCTPTARAYRMDPATGWTALAPLPAQNGTGRGGVTHAGMATDGTFIYWAGGYTSDAAGTGQIFGTKEVWRYDPVANTYVRMPDLPLVRSAGQLEYLNGELHYFGGTNSSRTADVGEHWELDLANTAAGWVARAPLPNPRNHLGSNVVGGVIYAVGGQHGHDDALVTQAQVDRYDQATDTWTPVANLPRAIGHISSSVFAMDGRLVVLGGETSHGSNTAEATAYDPDTNTWTALTPLPAPRHSGVADVIDGVMYYSTGNSSGTFKGVPQTPTPATQRFNFQPAGVPVPAGYTADTGLAFDAARGFGWVREDSLDSATHVALDISPNARDRNLLADQRLDTFNHMQYPTSSTNSTAVKIPAAWELAVTNGAYTVTVSVGDASAIFDSTHRINLEGQLALGPFVPSSGSQFASATKTVTIADGRLTIDARGGTNTKIDYVDITPATSADTTPPPAPPSLTATAGNGSVALNWGGSTASDLAGYRVYRSTSTPVALATPISGASLVTATSFTDTTAANGTTYFYVVVAIDTSGNASGPSPTASATPQAPPSAVDMKVNFQPAGAPVPTGYTADTGLGFDAARGFGWVREDSLGSATHVALDVSRNARDRNLVSDQRLDTFIHMQYPQNGPGPAVKTPAGWEAAVPNGTYTVTVGVGDAGGASFDSTHRIRLEGAVAIVGFVPTSTTRFAQATLTAVTVADGRLTVDAIGGTNTKIDFVTIATAAP